MCVVFVGIYISTMAIYITNSQHSMHVHCSIYCMFSYVKRIFHNYFSYYFNTSLKLTW